MLLPLGGPWLEYLEAWREWQRVAHLAESEERVQRQYLMEAKYKAAVKGGPMPPDLFLKR